MAKQNSKSPPSLVLPAVIIVVTITVFLLIINRNKTNPEPSRPEAKIEVSATNTPAQKSVPAPQVKQVVQDPTTKVEEKNANEESDSAQRTFLQTGKIKISLPENLTYTIVDVDADNILMLHGINRNSGDELIALARKGLTLPDEIGQFMNETKIGKSSEDILSPKRLPRPEKVVPFGKTSQLEPTMIWGIRGKMLERAIALTNRTDKEGSYVFIYTVPRTNLVQTENKLINLIKESSAQ